MWTLWIICIFLIIGIMNVIFCSYLNLNKAEKAFRPHRLRNELQILQILENLSSICCLHDNSLTISHNENCLLRVTTVWLFTQQQNLQTYEVTISNRKRSNDNNCLGYFEKDLTSEKKMNGFHSKQNFVRCEVFFTRSRVRQCSFRPMKIN